MTYNKPGIIFKESDIYEDKHILKENTTLDIHKYIKNVNITKEDSVSTINNTDIIPDTIYTIKNMTDNRSLFLDSIRNNRVF